MEIAEEPRWYLFVKMVVHPGEQLIHCRRLRPNLLQETGARKKLPAIVFHQKRYFLNGRIFLSGLFPQRQEHLPGVFLVFR